MKTRKYIKSEARNDFERIMEGHRLLAEHILKHPREKATITVPLESGKFVVLTANPRSL